MYGADARSNLNYFEKKNANNTVVYTSLCQKGRDLPLLCTLGYRV